MIGRLVDEKLTQDPSHTLWGDVAPLLYKNNFNLGNLEAALTTSEKMVPKVFNFKAHPQHVRVLKEGNIHAVNIANNHILDFSTVGLLETLETLDNAHIARVGAGKDMQEAREPLIVEVKGSKIGCLGYTDNEPSWIAGKATPGTNYIRVGDIERVAEDISKIRKLVDIVVITIHWGPNMVERPTKKTMSFAHAMIDHGADIIHGHSAHIFQRVEWYKEGLILYDTGDFVDDYYVDPLLRNDRSFLFVVGIENNKPKTLELHPVVISDFQVNLAQGEEKQQILERMKQLST